MENIKVNIPEEEIINQIENLIQCGELIQAQELTLKYENNSEVQFIRMKLLLKKGEDNKALEIANKKNFKNIPKIQSQKIKILIKQGRIEEAKKIGNEEEFKDNKYIQSQMLMIAIQENDFEKIKTIGSKEIFKDNEYIQSQMIRVFMLRNDFEQAKKIGSREIFKNNKYIQGQMIEIAIQESDFLKAKEIGERKNFSDCTKIQVQMMRVNLREGNLSKVKEIGNRDIFIDDEYIQHLMMIVAIKEGDVEGAKKIGNREIFIDSKRIQVEMKQIIKKEKRTKKIANQVKTMIYYNKINQDIIEEIKQRTDLIDEKKDLLLLAIYDKTKEIKNARNLAREAKKRTSNDSMINLIMNRIENKKNKIFDIGFYDNILNWEFDEELIEEYSKQQEEKEESEQNSLLNEESKFQASEQENKQNSFVNIESKIEDEKKSPVDSKTQVVIIKNYQKRKFKEKIKYDGNIDVKITKKKSAKYNNKVKDIINILKQDIPQIYIKMQSEDINTRRQAIERMDKIENLIIKLNESLRGVDSNDELESTQSQKFLENICNKYQILKQKKEQELDE